MNKKPQMQENTGIFQFLVCVFQQQVFAIHASEVMQVLKASQLEKNTKNDASLGCLMLQGSQTEVYAPLAWKNSKSLSLPIEQGKLLYCASAEPWLLWVEKIDQWSEVSKEDIFSLPPLTGSIANSMFSHLILYHEKLIPVVKLNGLKDFCRTSESAEEKSKDVHSRQATDPSNHQLKTHLQSQLFLFSTHGIQSFDQSLRFALSVRQLVEILHEIPPLSLIPCLPSHVLGLFQWRNQPIALIDLSCRMKLSPAMQKDNDCYLIVRAGAKGQCVGVVADRKLAIQPIPEGARRMSGFEEFEGVLGVFESELGPMVVPDLNELL